MSKKTLLELAKNVRVRNRYDEKITPEQIELAFGWLRGEVRLTQVAIIMKFPTNQYNQAYIYLARWLRRAYDTSRIKIV